MTDTIDYVALLEKQKKLTRDAQGRKGQKPTNKPGRAFFEMLFSKQAPRLNKDEFWIRTCFISYAYPPSTKAAAQLEPILISSLLLETHHRGRVLVLRTIGHPQRIQAVQNAVEDRNGDVDRLALYNTNPSVTPDEILPKGAIIAVREPFYKVTADGGYTIRIDHPSDLVRLSASHDLVPTALAPRVIELENSALTLKSEGNIAHGSVTAPRPPPQPANANLLLDRFEPAIADAQASIINSADPIGEATAKLNAKAYYRAGRAAYCLRNFHQAEAYFQEVERCTPGDDDAVHELNRAMCRIGEEKTGCYDFTAMSNGASVKRNRLNYADFIANTESRAAVKRGRGLFATKDIEAGGLILCEKAFAVAFGSKKPTETYTVINPNTNRGSMGSHATLLFDLMQKLSHNPRQAQLYLDLYDGSYTPKIDPQTIEGVTVIDTFRTEAISEFNHFGCPTVRSSDRPGQHASDAQEDEDSPLSSVGVWIVASRINHACDGNAVRAFIGDMMIVRASRDVSAGDEVLMRYCSPEMDSVATRDHTKKTWRFECDCAICEADSSTSHAQRERRRARVAEAKSFLGNHKLSMQYQPDAAAISKVEKLRIDIEATYNKALFAGKPRLGLVSLGLWLCQAYNFRSSRRKVIDCAVLVLRDLGYGITATEKKLAIDYSCCYLEYTAVDATMYAAHAHYALGDHKLGRQFEDVAKGLWTTLYAVPRGFAERYGPS